MSNIFIFGDSITHGDFDCEHGGWATRLKTYVCAQFILGKVGKLHVYPLGVPGEVSHDMRTRLLAEIAPREGSGGERMVILATGINDSKVILETQKNLVPLAEFEQIYRSVLSELKERSYACVAVGLTRANEAFPRTSPNAFVNSVIDQYDAVIKKLCDEYGCGYVSMADLFLTHPELLLDSVHPNAEGHRLMFERVKKYLEKHEIL